jgi:AraC-like DNA-binding protein
MPILQQYLFVIGSFQGLLLAYLLLFGSQSTTASRLLGSWCLLLAVNFALTFSQMGDEIHSFTFLMGWRNYLPASYGALLYLYCRHAIINRPLSVRDLWHTVPVLCCYLLNLEILFYSSEFKFSMTYFDVSQNFNHKISEIILFAQAFIYIGLSVRLLRSYQRQASDTLANYNPVIFSWLWKVIILDFIIWSLKAMSYLPGYHYYFSLLGDILIILLIYSIALAQWRTPKLFLIKQFVLERANSDEQEGSEQQSTNEHKRNNGALENETRRQLLNIVRQFMDQQHAYKDNQLTLNRLAEAIEVSTHHLSEVLNLEDGKNFYRFVNEYRINFVCEKLKRDQSVKIIDLAMEAGFSSKSTFNAVFKQLKAVTPSEYRKQLQAA